MVSSCYFSISKRKTHDIKTLWKCHAENECDTFTFPFLVEEWGSCVRMPVWCSWIDPYSTINWIKEKGAGRELFAVNVNEYKCGSSFLTPQRALLRDVLAHGGMKLSVSWQRLERELPHTPVLDMVHTQAHTPPHSRHLARYGGHWNKHDITLPELVLLPLLSQSGSPYQTVNPVNMSMPICEKEIGSPIVLLLTPALIKGIGRAANGGWLKWIGIWTHWFS